MGKGLVGSLVILVAASVSACVAPQFTYIADSSASTYFKVPSGWHKIDSSALSAQLNKNNSGSGPPSGVWEVAYDAATAPAATHLFSADSGQPFALALVATLNSPASNAMSYNGLRDLLLPVTSAARQSATQGGFPLTGFQLLHDAVLTPGQGVHGVRVTFNYTYPDGNTDTFDQVAFTNANNTEVYALMVHCLAACYSHRRNEIDTVMTSFTVRSP